MMRALDCLDDQTVLERLSQRLVVELEQLPMLKDVDTSLDSGDEEVHVRVQVSWIPPMYPGLAFTR